MTVTCFFYTSEFKKIYLSRSAFGLIIEDESKILEIEGQFKIEQSPFLIS